MRLEANDCVLYRPRNMSMWDAWMLERGGVVHAFHLMRPRTDDDADVEQTEMGHAITTDLIHWVEQPAILPPAGPGAFDDMQHWTGDAVEFEGQVHLFYTARSSAEMGLHQRVMVARTRDFVQWERMTTPVIIPDPRWYLTHPIEERAYTVSWRDPKLVWDESENLWHAFLAADAADGDFATRGCIAHAVSKDLRTWETRPPAFAPQRYACLEVPDVFRIGGLWYLTALTGSIYGNARDAIRDPHVTNGVIYAVAENLNGQFVEPHDNVLFGSQAVDAVACRSVNAGGKRYAYYWHSERALSVDSGPRTLGVLTTPKTVSVAGGRLQLGPSAATESVLKHPENVTLSDIATSSLRIGAGEWTIGEEELHVDSPVGWALRCLDNLLPVNLDLAVTIQVAGSGRAGVVFRAEPNAAHPAPGPDQAALALVLDAHAGVIELLALREFQVICARTVRTGDQARYRLRVIMFGEFLDVFLDETLMFSTTRYEPRGGAVGLIAESTEATYTDLVVRSHRDA